LRNGDTAKVVGQFPSCLRLIRRFELRGFGAVSAVGFGGQLRMAAMMCNESRTSSAGSARACANSVEDTVQSELKRFAHLLTESARPNGLQQDGVAMSLRLQ